MTPMLAVDALVAGYEPGLPILRGASLAVAAGEILALIGPNGAGKSTLVKAVAGLVPAESGSVRFRGAEILGRPAHRLVLDGLAFVPQTDNVFARLSVAENLELAGHRLGRRRAARLEGLYGLFPDLAERRRLLAGRLSGGQRQMLAVARALILEPALLLLDEPSAGLSPLLVRQLFAKLAEIRRGGVALLMVEQNVKAALALADRAVLLVEGRERLEGPAAALADDPAVAGLYLGAAA